MTIPEKIALVLILGHGLALLIAAMLLDRRSA